MGMQSGQQIKSGVDEKDTWRRMLLQIPAVSEKIADAIVLKYPTAMSFFLVVKSLSKKANALIGLEVPRDNGRLTHIGPIIAQRVVDCLLEMNPDNKVLE
jgi:hypothetical protein